MVQDNPYLEMWRSLFLDQTELNIFGKWSRLDQIWENWSSLHWLTLIILTYLHFEPLWSLMTKGEKNKDISVKGRNSVLRGEIVYQDSEKTTRGRIWLRGSKLMNLFDAFECAFHMYACIAQVFKLKFHAYVVYASCRIEWWNEELSCIGGS